MNEHEHDEGHWLDRTIHQVRAMGPLLPIMAVVFIGYLVVGAAMPAVPLHVHEGLGQGAFIVGLVAGAQFAAALISRIWAGQHADIRGGKRTVVIGLVAAAVAGLLFLLSLRFVAEPDTSVTILLLGRALHGGAQSFIVGGAVVWGLALLGPQNTGKILAWVGIAVYAALAVGAPAGTTLYADHGFAAIALATTLTALGALPLAVSIRSVAPAPAAKASLTRVARAVWVPGIGLALSGVGFGAITTFIVLLFADRGWALAWIAYTALSVAFMGGRVVFGHLPDKIGGAKVALVCVLIEAAGLALIWFAPWPELALVGAALTGFGYSLVYPGFGVEAVRRAPPQSRGLAMGAYTAFFDLSLGITSPLLGLIAGEAGQGAVFLASALLVFCAAPIALRLSCAAPPSHDAAGESTGGRNEASFRRGSAAHRREGQTPPRTDAGWGSRGGSPNRAGTNPRAPA